MYIYKIVNDIDNMEYVGITNDIELRTYQHFNCRDNKPLYNLMDKYGREHFSLEIIYDIPVSKERAERVESVLITLNEKKGVSLNGRTNFRFNCEYYNENRIIGLILRDNYRRLIPDSFYKDKSKNISCKGTKGITVRLTEDEHHYIKLLALQNNVSMSEMVSIIIKRYKENIDN